MSWRGKQIAFAPGWITAAGRRKRERHADAGKAVGEETQAAIDRAWEWVREHAPEAVEGNRGDATTHLVAKTLFDFVTNLDTAREMFQWWNQEKAFPAWDLDTLEEKLLGGMHYRLQPRGIASPDYMPLVPGLLEPIDAALDVETIETPKRRKIKSLWFKDAWPLSLTHSSKPLVEGLLDEEAFSVTYGASGSGKSFLMLDIAFHIAAGRPWNGKKVRQGPVAYVAAEGGTGIYKRLHALCKHYGVEAVPLAVIPVSVDLLKGSDMKELVEEIKMRQEEIGEPFVFICIDTVSRVLAGGNENGPEDMGLLVHRFDQLRAVTKAHLNAIHHTGKQAALGARGHSLLKAATDTEIEVAVAIKDKSFDLNVTKQREAEGGLSIRFNFKPIALGTDDRGAAVTSNAIEQAVVTTKDMDSPDLLRDAVAAKLEREGRETDEAVTRKFIVEAAAEAELADFSSRANSKNFRDRVDRMLAVACNLARMKRLKRGEYQCQFEACELSS